MMFQPVGDDLAMVMKFISNSPVVHLSANTYQQLAQPSVVSITANLCYALNRWNNAYTGAAPPTFAPAAAAAPAVDLSSGGGLNLPLTVDPLLATGHPTAPPPRRHLADQLDQGLQLVANNFATTVDSHYIFVSGYPDYSFRVIDSDTGACR
jgi:hypothetical protein